MSFASIQAAVRPSIRFFRGLSAVALGLAAAACGGGGEDSSAAPTDSSDKTAAVTNLVHMAAAPVSVMVEGCVLDRFYIPTTGTPVRALAADGRLLGSALSNGQGRFTMRLPAGGELMLQVDRPQGESLPMPIDARSP